MRKLISGVLFASLFFHLACSPRSNTDDGQKYVRGEELLLKALRHFYFASYSTQVQIDKVYSENFKTNDEMRMSGKYDGDHRKFMVQIKPGEKHKGRSVLVEGQGDKAIAAYTYSPGDKEVAKFNMGQVGGGGQTTADIVVGGLSFLDLQLLQGSLPRKRVSEEGTAEINSHSCYQLMIQYADGYEYDHVQFFATKDELLPVLLRIYDQKSAIIKEITFDKYDTVAGKSAVKVLIINDKVYGYTSNFTFGNTRIGDPIDDNIFTIENLKKGWGA